ncbi:MAG: Mut7-C RNAse domain-containing protein [Proteobacteria bacterium]|nr:Mut7-C RNAse domain-containing protein [Pseudomonadota bacterium]
MKFLADPTLGKLTKWLRILGYDTVYYMGDIDRSFLRKAQKEGRVALTRRRDMASRSFSGQMIIVCEDQVQNQIKEVTQKLSLKPDQGKLFSICLKCNKELKEVSREEVRGLVPDYVSENYKDFRMCPQCKGIFWPGTHRDNMLDEVKKMLDSG